MLSTLRAHNPIKVGYESSIYYYWFEFLKRSKPSARSKKVREDFGDINDVEFMEWWGEKGLLLFFFDNLDNDFSQFPTVGVRDLETAQESIDQGRFMVSIDMTYPKKVIMDRLKGIVDRQATAKVGIRKFKADKGGKYNIENKFDIKALKKTLAVYDLRIKDKKLSLWEIEEQINLIDKKSKNKGDIWHWGNSPTQLAAKRKVQTVTVSRYLRHAEKIIENVAKHGKFPVHGR